MHHFLRRATVFLGIFAVLPATGLADEGLERRRTPIVRAFEKCRDAVVNISTTRVVRMRSLTYGSMLDEFFDLGRPRVRHRRVESVGSGIVVHESGYILTNAHVVSQATDVHITFADGKTLPAQAVAVDPEHDLAVLKVDAPKPIAHQRLGRSDDIMVGETVIAVGNPLGLQHTVTRGIVSALGRDIVFSDDVIYQDLIQTDAPINPGNSGGPLLNINGELIGINTAIRGDAQNIGFAIPIDRVWELLPDMLNIERRQRVSFGLRVGGKDAEIVAIRDQSPADEAGLKLGDHIESFNGHELRNTIDFYAHLFDEKPGNEIRLGIRRGDDSRDVAVALKAIPIPDGRALALRLFGMQLEEIPERIRRQYDLPDYAGLVVESVERGSPADRVGMQPLDMILRLDRVPVVSLQDVGLALEQVTPGERVLVEGLRLDARRPFLWTVRMPTRRAP